MVETVQNVVSVVYLYYSKSSVSINIVPNSLFRNRALLAVCYMLLHLEVEDMFFRNVG
jgi:hypothetical protein